MLRVVSCMLFAVGSNAFGFSVVETTAATAAQVEVCHGSSSELELVTLDTGFPAEDSETRSDSLRATLAGGTLDVEAGQAMIVEVALSSLSLLGFDLGGNEPDYTARATVKMGVRLVGASGLSLLGLPGSVDMHSFKGEGTTDDDYSQSEDRTFQQTNAAKFVFAGLVEDSYDVEVDLTLETEARYFGKGGGGPRPKLKMLNATGRIVVGEHVVVARALDAHWNERAAGPQTLGASMSPQLECFAINGVRRSTHLSRP